MTTENVDGQSTADDFLQSAKEDKILFRVRQDWPSFGFVICMKF